MRVVDQLDAFTVRLKNWSELKGGFQERRAHGASNTPFPVKGGFRLGVWNIENTDFVGLVDEGKAFVLVSPITVPPGDYTLCNAIVFRERSLEMIGQRRDEIQVELEKRTNNVAFFLTQRGLILSPKTDLENVNFLDARNPEVGNPIAVSSAAFTDIQRPNSLCTVTDCYVDFLSNLLHPVRFVRLGVDGAPISLL